MALLGGDTNFVGIDIGSSGVRVVQLKHGGGQPLLVSYGDKTLPMTLTQSDAPLDRDKLVEAIGQLLSESGITAKQAILGIPSMKVFASVITVPRVKPEELATGIKYEAEKQVPMPLDQLKLDWSIIENSGNANEMEVLIVATPTQTAYKYSELCARLGLRLVGLEPNALAAERALIPKTSNTILLLDIGNLTTDVSITHLGTPRLVRSIAVGSTTFVKSVAQHLGVTDQQSEQFISKFGLTKDKLEGQVLVGIKPAVDSLIAEVQKSMQYFTEHHQGMNIEKAIVTGSASFVSGLPAYLATGLNLPIEIGNPWANIAYPANIQEQLLGVASKYAVASGLAQMEVS